MRVSVHQSGLTSRRLGDMNVLARVIDNWRIREHLLLVNDGTGWVIDEVARNLCANLSPELRAQVVTNRWRNARDSVIHFINRAWAWSDGVLDGVDSSNAVIGLWWHGRLDSPDRGIQSSLERLRHLQKRFAFIQVPCCSAMETMLAIGIPKERVVLLPEGIDLKRFHPPTAKQRNDRRKKLGLSEDTLTIGCFQKDGQGWGDGEEPKLIKGPDILVEVLKRLRGQYPVHAVIPGPARGYVKRCLQDAGVPFSAPGFVRATEDFERYYDALDLYLSPSRDEGGPAGVLESMASGVPVVSTRTGMAADLLQDRVSGVLADVDDIDGLTAAAATLIDHPALRYELAQRALVTIQSYDWTVLAPQYAEQLYYPLIRSRAGS